MTNHVRHEITLIAGGRAVPAIVDVYVRDEDRGEYYSEATLVVVIHPPTGYERPITMWLEDVVGEVVSRELVPDRDRVIWIEHQPLVIGMSPESWEIVTFGWRMLESGDEIAFSPGWVSITKDAADVICGGDAVPV